MIDVVTHLDEFLIGSLESVVPKSQYLASKRSWVTCEFMDFSGFCTYSLNCVTLKLGSLFFVEVTTQCFLCAVDRTRETFLPRYMHLQHAFLCRSSSITRIL